MQRGGCYSSPFHVVRIKEFPILAKQVSRNQFTHCFILRISIVFSPPVFAAPEAGRLANFSLRLAQSPKKGCWRLTRMTLDSTPLDHNYETNPPPPPPLPPPQNFSLSSTTTSTPHTTTTSSTHQPATTHHVCPATKGRHSDLLRTEHCYELVKDREVVGESSCLA